MSSNVELGLSIPTAVDADRHPVAIAQRAERLGFDFVGCSDHPGDATPNYETWTLLTWMAAVTSRIRIGSRVLCVPIRPAALTAKMAETFQRLSGDRLILGLGGGSVDDEIRAYGGGTPTPRDKVDGLDEAIRIMRGMWTQPSFSLAGRIHQAVEARLEPKPGTCPPIWLGTYGKRALALTGRLADGWIPSLGLVPPDAAVPMRQRILDAAEASGRKRDDITCIYHLQVRVGDRVDEAGVVSGPATRIVDELFGFMSVGFTAFSMSIVGPDPGDQLERLGAEVLPAFRAAVDDPVRA